MDKNILRGTGKATGTDTYAVTLSVKDSSYVGLADGTQRGVYLVSFANTNTGASTLNVNGLGAKTIFKNGSTGLDAGDIVVDRVYVLIYDGTNFQLIFDEEIPANERIDHSTVSITTSTTSGLNGGGDLTATRNIVAAPERATALGVAPDGADLFLIADVDNSNALRSVTITDLLSLAPSTNMANNDEQLTANRTHDMNGNYFAFQQSASDVFKVESTGNTLWNGGWLQWNGSQTLHLNKSGGVIKLSNGTSTAIQLNATGYLDIYSGGVLQTQILGGRIFFANGSGTTTWDIEERTNGLRFDEKINGNVFHFAQDGNFGVGTETESAKVHVVGSGSTSATTSLLIQNSSSADLLKVVDDGTVYMDGTAWQWNGTETQHIQVNNANIKLSNGAGTKQSELTNGALKTYSTGTLQSVYGPGYIQLYSSGGSITWTLEERPTGFRFQDAVSSNNFFFGSNGNFGVGTDTPDASAITDLTSTTKGFLTPRVTTAQKTSISTPATGLMVYDTNDAEHSAYNGAEWETVGVTKRIKKSLTNGEILALNATPIEVIPAPGAGYAVEILSATLRFNYGSAAFATNTTLRLRNPSATNPQYFSTSFLSNTATKIILANRNPSATNSAVVENEKIEAFVPTGNPTSGTGSTVDIYLTYRIITL